MRKLWIVVKNELMRYFISPLAYIYLVSFLILNAVCAFYFGHLFERGQASLFYMFCFLPWLYLLFLPGISMRLWAEEFRSKSIVQIMTMPVSLPVLVWGKFLASLVFCLIALCLTFPFVITVNVLGSPDNNVILLSYFASFMLAGAMLAISQTMSALTKNQVIALVLAVIANLIFFFSGLEFVLSFFRLFLPDYMIDTIASFSFLTHFSSQINGLLEWRDILFFASLIILFNFTTMLIVAFRTSGTSFWLKSNNKMSYIVAWFMLMIGFAGFNLLANNLTRGTQFDFTEEKVWTLSQNTKDILQNLEEPVTAKLYFSSILARRNPDLRQVFDRVKMLLQNYKNASNGKFDFRIYHPQNLDSIEDKGISDGLQPIPLIDVNQNALFGISIVDALDNKEVIPYLSAERLSFLEQDLTTLIYRLSKNKKTVGIISSLPVLGGSQGEGSMIFQPFEIADKIGELYQVKPIQTPEDLDDKIDVLMMVHPRGLSEEMVEKIKAYSRNYGSILLLLDNAAEAKRLFMAENSPYGASDLGGLDSFWGFKFYNEYVVADLDNSMTVDATSNYKTNPAYTQDVIEFTLKEQNFSPFHPVTRHLKEMMMTSVGVIMPEDGADVHFMPILMASENSELMPISVVYDGLNPRQILSRFEKDANVKILAAYIHGQNPDNQFDLIVVGDSDFIYNDFWGTSKTFLDEKYFVPLFNNADFILNALDFLTADTKLLNLRGKGARNRPFKGIETLRRQSMFEYKIKEEEIFSKIERAKKGLSEIFGKRDFEERTMFTADELSLISNMKKSLESLKKELSDLRLQSASKIEKIALEVKLINIFGVPLLLSLILLVFYLKTKKNMPKRETGYVLSLPLMKACALAVLILGLGVLSVWVHNKSEIENYEGKAILPDLPEKMNMISEIIIQNSEAKLDFIRQDDLWVLKNVPEIPVYQERIRSFLSALVEATFYEKKSNKAENLKNFELEGLENPDSKTTRIKLLSQQGDVLETLDVGKYDIELGRGGSAAYIKFEDKFQVWLAQVEFVDLSADWHEWTYSHFWDLRFGRLSEINGSNDGTLIAEYMKHFLNTLFNKAHEDIENKEKIYSFNLRLEDDTHCNVTIFEADGKYFVKYDFEKTTTNKHIELFAKSADKYYFEISSEDWNKIKNVSQVE